MVGWNGYFFGEPGFPGSLEGKSMWPLNHCSVLFSGASAESAGIYTSFGP